MYPIDLHTLFFPSAVSLLLSSEQTLDYFSSIGGPHVIFGRLERMRNYYSSVALTDRYREDMQFPFTSVYHFVNYLSR